MDPIVSSPVPLQGTLFMLPLPLRRAYEGFIAAVGPAFMRSPARSAHTVMYAALAPTDEVGGRYIADGRVMRPHEVSLVVLGVGCPWPACARTPLMGQQAYYGTAAAVEMSSHCSGAWATGGALRLLVRRCASCPCDSGYSAARLELHEMQLATGHPSDTTPKSAAPDAGSGRCKQSAGALGPGQQIDGHRHRLITNLVTLARQHFVHACACLNGTNVFKDSLLSN